MSSSLGRLSILWHDKSVVMDEPATLAQREKESSLDWLAPFLSPERTEKSTLSSTQSLYLTAIIYSHHCLNSSWTDVPECLSVRNPVVKACWWFLQKVNCFMKLHWCLSSSSGCCVEHSPADFLFNQVSDQREKWCWRLTCLLKYDPKRLTISCFIFASSTSCLCSGFPSGHYSPSTLACSTVSDFSCLCDVVVCERVELEAV